MSQCKFNCPNFKKGNFDNYCRCNNKSSCCDCSKRGLCKWCVSWRSDKKTTFGRCIPIDRYNDSLCPPNIQVGDCGTLNKKINLYVSQPPKIYIKSNKEEVKPQQQQKPIEKQVINKIVYKVEEKKKDMDYKNILIFILSIIIFMFLLVYIKNN